jgi:hypothetical protein
MLSQLLLLRTHTDTMPKAMATTKPSGEATESASSPSPVRMLELEAAITVRYAIELSAVSKEREEGCDIPNDDGSYDSNAHQWMLSAPPLRRGRAGKASN